MNAKTIKTAEALAAQAARFAYLAGANQVLVCDIIAAREAARRAVPHIMGDFRNVEWWTHTAKMWTQNAAQCARKGDAQGAHRFAMKAARDAELAAAFAA